MCSQHNASVDANIVRGCKQQAKAPGFRNTAAGAETRREEFRHT